MGCLIVTDKAKGKKNEMEKREREVGSEDSRQRKFYLEKRAFFFFF